MRRLALWTSLLCGCAATLSTGCSAPGDMKGRAGFSLGVRQFGEDAEPAETHGDLGFEYAARGESGIGFEVGTHLSGGAGSSNGVDVVQGAFELYGGARYTYDGGAVLPFVSGGVSLLSQAVETEVLGFQEDEDDASAGLYLAGGVDFPVSEKMYLGLQLRRTFGQEFDSGGITADTDSTQYLFRIGWLF